MTPAITHVEAELPAKTPASCRSFCSSQLALLLLSPATPASSVVSCGRPVAGDVLSNDVERTGELGTRGVEVVTVGDSGGSVGLAVLVDTGGAVLVGQPVSCSRW